MADQELPVFQKGQMVQSATHGVVEFKGMDNYMGEVSYHFYSHEYRRDCYWLPRALKAHVPASFKSAEPVSVPTVQAGDDWKLAPFNPTEEMIQAACMQQSLEKFDTYQDWWNSHSSGVSERIRKMLIGDYVAMISAAPSQPVAVLYPIERVLTDAEHLALRAESFMRYLDEHSDPDDCVINPDEGYGDHVHSIRLAIHEFRKRHERYNESITTANAGKDAKPTYTTGHCEHNKQPGGCQQHNLHCGWPKCDQKEIK